MHMHSKLLVHLGHRRRQSTCVKVGKRSTKCAGVATAAYKGLTATGTPTCTRDTPLTVPPTAHSGTEGAMAVGLTTKIANPAIG